LYQGIDKRLKEYVNKCLRLSEKKGLESSGPLYLPKVHITEAKEVVLDSKEPEEDKHKWLKDLVRPTINDLGHSSSQLVRGYCFKFQQRVNFDSGNLVDSIGDYSDATIIQESRERKSNSNQTNPPFSYDPAQEFVTEL